MKNFNKLVDAVNYLYQYIPQIVTDVKKQLDPHIGKPIFKADGSWRKSVNWVTNPVKKRLPNGDFLTVDYYVQQRSGYVSLSIKVCLNGGSYEVHPSTAFTIYQEAGLTIYTVDENGNIVDFDIDLDQWNVEFDSDELVRQSEVITAKVKELESEINKIHYRFRDGLYIPNIR